MPVVNRTADFAPGMTAWRLQLHRFPDPGGDSPRAATAPSPQPCASGRNEIHASIAQTGFMLFINGRAHPGHEFNDAMAPVGASVLARPSEQAQPAG